MRSLSLSSILFLSVIYLLSIFRDTSAQKSLCDDPYIHSADRMANNTYRVYRGEHYWDLIGLPEKVAKVDGPYPIWWPNMAPMTKDAAVSTLVGGSGNGITFKYQGSKFWSWNENGRQREGGKSGSSWSGFPKGTSFSAAFNDADLDKKGYPMMIFFSGIRAYYFRTSSLTFKPVGNEGGYIPPGQFGEKFPGDLTAAMAFPSTDPDVKYYVYLFKREKHCFRPITGEDGCKQWRENKELFGCSSGSGGGSKKTDSGSDSGPKDTPDSGAPKPSNNDNSNPQREPGIDDNTTDCCPTESQNFYLFLFIVFLSNILIKF